MSEKLFDYTNGVGVVRTEKLQSSDVIAAYNHNVASKNITVDKDAAMSMVDVRTFGNYPEGSKDAAKAIAQRLYVAIYAMVNWKEIGLDETYLRWFHSLIDFAVKLGESNPYVGNIVSSGKGWKFVFNKWPLAPHRLAAMIAIVNNREHVVFDEDGNYLVPNLDKQVGDGRGDKAAGFITLANELALQDARDNKEFMAKFKASAPEIKADEIIGKVRKEVKMATNNIKEEASSEKKKLKRKKVIHVSSAGGGGSSSDKELIGAAIFGAVALGVGAYAGYKAYEYFNSTTVTSSNKFGSFKW